MGSLIKNEFIKIFRKKSTYIVLIIFLLFIILTNCIYKFMNSVGNQENYKTSDQYIQYAKEEINKIDINSNREEYIELKTDLDYNDLYKKYDKNSWQIFIIERDFYEYLYNINIYKYGTNADKELLRENPEEVYNRELEKLNNSDWKSFVNDEIQNIEKELNEAKQQKELLSETSNNKQTDELIKTLETKLELTKMRIEKDIPYGKNYMNDAIETRINMANISNDYDEPNMSYEDKVAQQSAIESSEKAKFIIENKMDINKTNSARGVLLNMFDEYSIFLVIFVVMIAGGIVSSEMEKGTIKMLLVKPFKRGKILFAKYFVSMFMVLFIFAVTIILQTIIGGLIFGFDSLSVPAIIYNFKTNTIQSYNLFAYILILGLTKLPIYILLGTLAFAISCIFGNTVLAIVLPILGNIAGNIINTLVSIKQIKQLAIFPTLNWDLSQFLFGKLPVYQFTSFKFALGVCIIYWLIMVICAWIAFDKKEIKNI